MNKKNQQNATKDEAMLNAAIKPHVSDFVYILRVLFSRKIVVFGIVVIFVILIAAIFAPLLAPYDPYEQHMSQALLQSSRQHILGTDTFGRDTLSRLIYGTRNSLMVAVTCLLIASTCGMAIGLVAGYFGGWVYIVLMRFVDALMCFPTLLLALVVAAVLGGGLKNIVVALGFAMLPGYARLMCGQVLSVKQNDYILAMRSMGASNLRMMLRHVFPNCFPPLIVLVTMQIGLAILAEAGLSFLGFGIDPPAAAWGTMVNDGRAYLLTNPILSLAPGLCIMLFVFAANMLGDGLRDALDPRLRGII
jgi:ABC-type dipeptide/oligopeptide/nickel transport system permease subunit